MIENLVAAAERRHSDADLFCTRLSADGSATVELNGQRLKVGQRAGPVVVRDILVDSVILEKSGVIFRLTALNSWINM